MKTIYRILPIVALAAISFSNFSCDKVDLEKLDEYVVSVDDVESVMQTEAMLNVAFIDVFNIGVRAGAYYDEVSALGKTKVVPDTGIMGGSMTVQVVDGSNPYSLVIADWTDVNIVNNDGFSRRGGLVAKVNSLWHKKGSVIDITFGIPSNIANSIGVEPRTAYYFNNYKIEGKVRLENLGEGKFNFKVIDGVITSPDGVKIAKRNSNLFLHWEGGVDTTMDISDDVWNIYGTVEGITTTNMEYEISIEESNFLLMTSCEFPLKGIADFMIKKVKFSLDYAPESEECDSKAELEFYGAKKIIDFKEEVN